MADIKKMRWREFIDLLVGIDPKTPLGRIVSIRAEEDKDVLKYFTDEQKRIRNDWRAKHPRVTTKADMEQVIMDLESVFLQMVGVTPAED